MQNKRQLDSSLCMFLILFRQNLGEEDRGDAELTIFDKAPGKWNCGSWKNGMKVCESDKADALSREI
jgi:hypothetical protein